MKTLRRHGIFALLFCLTMGGCVLPARMGAPKDGLSWPATLAAAQQAASSGRFQEADALLTSYAAAHLGTVEARETEYWRGLYKLDPTNRDASVEVALGALDQYIAYGTATAHHEEALTLRRLGGQVATLSRLASASTTTQTSAQRPVIVEDKGKDDEVQRLRAELAKANEELERIKKRLTAPKP